MSECSTYVGLDVHKRSISAAMIQVGRKEVERAEFGTDSRGVGRLVKWLARDSTGSVRCCYEAGPCGYELQRRLAEAGVDCRVVAPSKVWRQSGERRKNDRRDAVKLAQQLSMGVLTEVREPTVREEAIRGLVRDRDAAQREVRRSKQQIVSFLDLQGVRWAESRWTKAHRSWLQQVRLSDGDAQFVLEDRLLALAQSEQRLGRLDARIELVAEREEYRDAVGRLCCFRGVNTLPAMVFLAELYQFGRFETPRALMGFVVLIPGEHSTGDREQTGGLTKTGNGWVRRLMVEASKHYRQRPTLSRRLLRRQSGQPASAVASAQTALTRLHGRYWHLVNREKHPNKATAAVARELVGFLWAALQGSPVAIRRAA